MNYEGREPYFINLGYVKAEDDNSEGTMTINSVKLYSIDDNYKITITENGQKNILLSEGTYSIKETKTVEGYKLNKEPVLIEVTAEGEKKVTIENTKKSKVTVHHYLKEGDTYTTKKIAEDETYYGEIGENYETFPLVDLENLKLEKDENDVYVIPEKARGTFESSEIIYM